MTLPAFLLKQNQVSEYKEIVFSTLTEVIEQYYNVDFSTMKRSTRRTNEQSKAVYTFIVIAYKLAFSSVDIGNHVKMSRYSCYPKRALDNMVLDNNYNEIVKIFANKLKLNYGNRIF